MITNCRECYEFTHQLFVERSAAGRLLAHLQAAPPPRPDAARGAYSEWWEEIQSLAEQYQALQPSPSVPFIPENERRSKRERWRR